MSRALYKFIVDTSDTPDLRKRAEDLTDEVVDAAGLTGHGLYLRGSGCYLFLEGDADDPLAALRGSSKGRSWLGQVSGASTFDPADPEGHAFRMLSSAGTLPAEEARFYRLLCDPADEDTVADAFESLPADEATGLGAEGLEAWWRAPELVLRVNASDDGWLHAPVQSLAGATLMEFLHRHTDLNPDMADRFALTEIHHILDDTHPVGVTRSPA